MTAAVPVTVWQRYDHYDKKTEQTALEWRHNHLETGHSADSSPTPVSDIQRKSWQGGTWRKQLGVLVNSQFEGLRA